MESKKNNSVQNLFFSFFKQTETVSKKELDAVVLIQHWWRKNQWKRFYTIPEIEIETLRLDTDVISTECNIGDLVYNYYVNKRKFVDTDDDEAGDTSDTSDTSNTGDTGDTTDDTSVISDAKSDYENESETKKQESLVDRYENLIVNHNNFINDFFNSFFAFIYNGIKFMFGF